MLVDGLKGKNTNYRTGRWLGFQGDDLVAIIDMQEPTEISSIEVNNAVVTGDWIFDSSEIIVESSDDKRNFSSIITEKISDQKSEHWSDISTHNFSFDPVTARYYRITIKPTVMPEWHPGSGRRAFIFVDEISLN
jgi:hexosaminidase